jgi:heme-degrading monooxygenase HmoA
MPSVCKEIVIYEIKSECEAEFLQVHQEVQIALSALPGFMTHSKEAALDRPHHYMDTVVWRSEREAKAAFEVFSTLPPAKRFMATIKKVIFSGHF